MKERFVVIAAMVMAACGGGEPSTPCSSLLPGDLVITEVFSDPAGPDEGSEWFEIYNASDGPAALEGLTITHSRGDGQMRHATTLDEVTLGPGEYLVLGNVADEFRPSWVNVGYGSKLGDLYNTGAGRIALACGATEIDAATYGSVRSGLSRQLDGGHPPDYTVNDDPTQWCSASKAAPNEFSTGNYGTPGAANEDCEIIVPGMCDDGESLRPVMAPGPGDLVITEVMPNPNAVADAMGEWFEVQAVRDVDLNGLGVDRVGDTAAAEVVLAERCLHVPAGGFAVFAHGADAGINGGLPRVDALFKFSLVTGSGSAPGDIALTYGSTIIDSITWMSSRTGKSLQVDPSAATSSGNDVAANFCDGTQLYGEGDLGTPGAPNASCPAVAPPGTCFDGASSRMTVAPVAGDLVITEVMPSPNAVSDTVGEWFEVLATRDVDLNGVELDRALDTANPNVITSASCMRLRAGDRALFARSSDPTLNGGLPAVTSGFTFSLITGSSTSPGDVRVLYDGGVLDAVTWTGSTAGASLQLDADFSSPSDNDVETNWCDGTAAYGAGDLGTPGMPNAQCGAGPAPGTCLDTGVARPVVAPAVGDLVITEVMPNPSAVSDTLGEWFEVLVTRDVDLNGVGLDRAGDTANPMLIASADCVRAVSGTYLVFARSADPTLNGGLPPVTRTFGFSLVSGSTTSPGDVRLVLGATTLDSFLWTHSSGGASLQVDPDLASPTDNDDELAWCDGTIAYGAGDLGTPGAPNAQCMTAPAPGMCDAGGGILRPIVKPASGQLVITEIMPNPKIEPGQEWFEISNTGTTSFDLNELGLDRASDTRPPDVIQAVACKPLAPQAYALFARSSDPASNGGLPTPDATFGFSMVNTSGELRVLDGANVLDAVTWSSSSDGVSSQLDPDLYSTSLNDLAASFCAATSPYGDGTNKGTPRVGNLQCP